MYYIAMIFHANLQSWGAKNLPIYNKESPRNTYLMPTKSAVIGILRSALGEQRTQSTEYEWDTFRFLTRVDRSGIIKRDYSIAQRTHHGFKAGGTKEVPKYYLEDSTFVVLVGNKNKEYIEALKNALAKPKWSPFLGRRAYVPSLPLLLGTVKTDNPRDLLETLPIIWNQYEKQKNVTITDSLIFENDTTATMEDQPNGLNPKNNFYTDRSFTQYHFTATNNFNEDIKNTILDQYSELRESFN